MYNVCFVCNDEKISRTASIFSSITNNYQKTNEVLATFIDPRDGTACNKALRNSNLIVIGDVPLLDCTAEPLLLMPDIRIALNADDKRCLRFAANAAMSRQGLADMGLRLITYGFNTRATLTASSIDHDCDGCLLSMQRCSLSMQLCLQRALLTLAGTKLVPYEFSFKTLHEGSPDVYDKLAAVTAALAIGVDFDNSERIVF